MSYRIIIDDLTLPIEILDKKKSTQNTVAKTKLLIDLKENKSNPTAENIIAFLEEHIHQMTINEIPDLLGLMNTAYPSIQHTTITLKFPYFITKTETITTQFTITRSNEALIDFILQVSLLLDTRKYLLDISIRSKHFIWIETLQEIFLEFPDSTKLTIEELQSQVNERLLPLNPSWFLINLKLISSRFYSTQFEWSWPQTQTSPKPIQPLQQQHLSFGKWLQKQRKNRHISQQKLAEQLEIANSTLSRVESEEIPPSKSILHKLGNLWDYPLDYLSLKAKTPTPELLDILSNNIDEFLLWAKQKEQSE